MKTVLYITYDGLTDPLGQSQVLAYLKRLADQERRVVILSFEKEGVYESNRDDIERAIKGKDLIWIPLRYTKHPPVLSTILDISRGKKIATKLYEQYGFDIIHCRGYIASLIGSYLKRKFQSKMIFDMRGWWADEKRESGHWNGPVYHPVYRYFKKLEKGYFSQADFTVSLTFAGKEEIVQKGLAPAEKVGVIPTCVDFEIFQKPDEKVRVGTRKELGIPMEKKVFIYSGSVGGNYDFEFLIKVYTRFLNLYPDSHLLVLSKEKVEDATTKALREAGISAFSILSVPFKEVSTYLRAADVALIIYKPTYSNIGRSPTKLGEYWASGIPVISFRGIGDLDLLFSKYPEGGVLLATDDQGWEEEMKKLRFTEGARIRSYAKEYFHIDKGIAFYDQVYKRLS